MQFIERTIKSNEHFRKEIKCFGMNSKGILSIIFNDDSMLNFLSEEAENLKDFLNKQFISKEKIVFKDKNPELTIEDNTTNCGHSFYL